MAVVEKLYEYSGAPNGETEFPNVFRKFIANDEPVSFTTEGETQTFNYKFEIDTTNWVADQIYILAYVVDSNTKEVLNSGTNYDSKVDLLSESTLKRK
ncbi:MAG: hypothetical protein R2771_11310 [Saprospiraceae bacterium]